MAFVHVRLSNAALVLLCACAGAKPVAQVGSYPALAPEKGPPTFAQDAALTPLSLACDPDEPELPNGLDDNCDGRIDGKDVPDGLRIAIAHPETAALELVLSKDGKEVPLSSETKPSACDAQAAFAVHELSPFGLPAGSYTLSLRYARACGEDAALSASAAVQDAKSVHTYLVRIEPLQTVALGVITIP